MSSRCLLLLLVAVAAAAAPSAAKYVGAWYPVPDVNAPFIQGLGRWAVKHAGIALSFEKVVAAGYQNNGDGGTNYDLAIVASLRLGVDEKYLAVVFEHDGTAALQLLSFDAARGPPPPSPRS
ncbi:hypothetical protein ACP70R_020581 [Stipagrostis hirtigluma subsp. patula]